MKNKGLKIPHGIETMQYISELYDRSVKETLSANRVRNLESKKKSLEKENKPSLKSLQDELLRKIKRDLPWCSSCFRIEVVRIVEDNGVAKLYFHICNSDAHEELEAYSIYRQDGYGIIDADGKMVTYFSRFMENPSEIPFSTYSKEDLEIIRGIKSSISKEKERMKEEENEWNKKSSIRKLLAKFIGKEPKSVQKLNELLSNIPEYLSITRSDNYRKSLMVKDIKKVGEKNQNTKEQILNSCNIENKTNIDEER
jgi:hypothetical protein